MIGRRDDPGFHPDPSKRLETAKAHVRGPVETLLQNLLNACMTPRFSKRRAT